jgi:hypothetical protein
MNLLYADYPCVSDIIVAMEIHLKPILGDEATIDIEDLVYDVISEWDKVFSDDDEWFNEDDTDVKDSLRDQVLEFLGY